MKLDHFGMDTITLAGPLEAKLRGGARRRLYRRSCSTPRDIVGHPAASWRRSAAVRASGLRGHRLPGPARLRGPVRAPARYKVDVAKAMLEMCRRPRLARCCWSARRRRATRPTRPRRWSRTCRSSRCWRSRTASAWPTRRCPGADSSTSTRSPGISCGPPIAPTSASAWTRSTSWPPTATWTTLADIDPRKVFLVQLSDFMWQEARSRDERIDTARTLSRLPRRGRAQREAGRVGASRGRDRLPRRLQLRGVQRRLPHLAPADGGRASAPVGEVAHRSGLTPQFAAAACSPTRRASPGVSGRAAHPRPTAAPTVLMRD